MTDRKTKLLAIKTTWKNFAEFADAAALASVSGYAIFQAIHNKGYWYKALFFAGALIALQAFVLLVKHFNKSPVTTGGK